MFGYVRPYQAEMRMREYEEYKAVYCQLCKMLGKHFGVGARLTLSFDCTFYAMVSLALNNPALTVRARRCVVNPAKKCKYIASADDTYHRAAALSILMTYHKFRDNIDDEKGIKRLLCRMGATLLSRKRKKAAEAFPDMDKAVENLMEMQRTVEGETQPSIDACAEPTAHLLATLLTALVPEGDPQRAALWQLGYHLGRWVYLMDAADDLKSDIEAGRFNPFISKLGLQVCNPKAADAQAYAGALRKDAEIACNEVLNASVANMIPAMNLLTFHQFGDIIENIVCKGLPELQREIIFLHVKEKQHDRSV